MPEWKRTTLYVIRFSADRLRLRLIRPRNLSKRSIKMQLRKSECASFLKSRCAKRLPPPWMKSTWREMQDAMNLSRLSHVLAYALFQAKKWYVKTIENSNAYLGQNECSDAMIVCAGYRLEQLACFCWFLTLNFWNSPILIISGTGQGSRMQRDGQVWITIRENCSYSWAWVNHLSWGYLSKSESENATVNNPRSAFRLGFLFCIILMLTKQFNKCVPRTKTATEGAVMSARTTITSIAWSVITRKVLVSGNSAKRIMCLAECNNVCAVSED